MECYAVRWGCSTTPNQRRSGVPMKSTVVRLTACLSSILSLASCSGQNATSSTCNAGDPGCLAGGGSNSTGGSTPGSTLGGASAVGGVPSTGTGGSTANG